MNWEKKKQTTQEQPKARLVRLSQKNASLRKHHFAVVSVWASQDVEHCVMSLSQHRGVVVLTLESGIPGEPGSSLSREWLRSGVE